MLGLTYTYDYRPLEGAIELVLNLAHSINPILNFSRNRPRTRIRTLDLALEFTNANIFRNTNLDELIRSLENIQKNESNKPNKNANRAEKEAFIESIYALWFSALGVDVEATTLSSEESQTLADYCYICELMIRCKENATRVSPDVWNSIESSILTVPD